MINIDLSEKLAALGVHVMNVVARGAGFYDSEPSESAFYRNHRLATVKITGNAAGGETYDIETVDGGVTVGGGVYNIFTEKGE